jgi:hypothetical protein
MAFSPTTLVLVSLFEKCLPRRKTPAQFSCQPDLLRPAIATVKPQR